MMSGMRKLICPLVLTAFLLPAQPQPQPVQSPVVQPDKTVTFRFRAPNAQKVDVRLDSGKSFPLAKDDKGVWTATPPPLPPTFTATASRLMASARLTPSTAR